MSTEETGSVAAGKNATPGVKNGARNGNGGDEKRAVALSSVLAAIGLTVFKLAVGLLTGSLGILSEALHSLLDLVAALMTLFAVRVSDKPADEVHQFGHGKVENLSALGETVLLLITCAWIIYEAFMRLFVRPAKVEINIWAFVVMAVAIIVDVSRSRVLMRAAKAHNSQALEADALHFSTDVWSSSVVIAGLICVWVGERYNVPWLVKADSVAALIVALIVVWISIQLGRRTVRVLLDAAPAGLNGQIEKAALAISGVHEVHQVRVRQAGPQVFVELRIVVPPGLSLEEGHAIASKVEEAICKLSPDADVIVHVDTQSPAQDNLPALVRSVAGEHGIRVHGLSAHEVGGRLTLYLHVEVNHELTLQAAHDQVSAFERDVRQTVGQSVEIVSHIEPVDAALQIEPAQRTLNEADMRAVVQRVLGEICGPHAAHDIQIIIGSYGQRDLTMHCHLSGNISITEAHRLSELAEKELHQRLPQLGRIVIHMEPGKS
jgi:cation diffusion facilitator family transporter